MVEIGEIFKTVVESLPPVNIGGTDYPINFFDGVIGDTKEQINNYKKAARMPWPCVWLLRDIDGDESKNRVTYNNLTVLLLIDTRNDYQTPERLDNRINPVLLPIKDNLIKGLKRAGVFVPTVKPKKLTHLGNPNAAIASPNQRGKLFGDYLDGLKLVMNLNYEFNLKLDCYDFR